MFALCAFFEGVGGKSVTVLFFFTMCCAPRRACVGSIGHVWGLPGPLAWHSVSCSNICVMHAYPPWHVLSIRSCVLARLSTEPPCVMARPQGSIHSMGAHRLHPFILVRPGHGAGRGAAQGGGAGQVLAWWGHHRRWAQSSAHPGRPLAIASWSARTPRATRRACRRGAGTCSDHACAFFFLPAGRLSCGPGLPSAAAAAAAATAAPAPAAAEPAGCARRTADGKAGGA